MGLIVFWIVSSTMWSYIECFQMISINYTTNWFICVVLPIGFEAFFAIIASKASIRQISCVRDQ